MPYQIRTLYWIAGMVLFAIQVSAQHKIKSEDELAVIIRPSADSITLRWAPLSAEYWHTANKYGYTIERFTLLRNGKVLRPSEQKVLTTIALKPLPEDQWAKFVSNKYGLIAAQALYGETFELNIEHTDIMQIANKAKENEQRYSIALFCADVSPAVAKAEGLYFSDKHIGKNEKYLYRIRVITPTDTLKGSIFIDPSQKYQLPSVAGFRGQTTGNVVTLQWNKAELSSLYTTYSVERSEDGKTFLPITDVAGVTLSKKGQDSKYQYAVDTLAAIGKEYSYRVKGITPFGEYGPASNPVKVKGNRVTTSNVFITSASSTDNKSISIRWDFPEGENDALEGFEVTRSSKSSGPYKTIHKDILPVVSRTFQDKTPAHSNYYKVKARTLDGTEITSMPYLALLVDSIPPAVPVGLNGKVDEFGNVTVHWKQNTDPDIYGYRIYRAYYQSEEFALMTGDPVKDTTFTDQVELKSLNEKIHYQVMAIDKNQNHSSLSTVLSLALPDKVPPMPPVWLPVKSTKEGVILSWQPSGSQDVVKYEVYRKGDQGQWIRLSTLPAGNDSVYRYTDQNLAGGETQYYTLVAVDDASLESPPAPIVAGFILAKPRQGVEMNEPVVDRVNRKITLSWKYSEGNVTSYRVYRTVNDGPQQSYRTVKDMQFTDSGMVVDGRYSYQIIAVFANGSFSELSKEVAVKY